MPPASFICYNDPALAARSVSSGLIPGPARRRPVPLAAIADLSSTAKATSSRSAHGSPTELVSLSHKPSEEPDSQPISARLAAAASRRADLELLLAAAPPDASQDQFRRLVLEQNVAGKGSAVSREKLWAQLRLRYVLDRSIPECAAFLSAMASASSPTERGLLCLLMMARTDRLLREMTLRSVGPLLTKDGVLIPTGQLQSDLDSYIKEHGLEWSPDTLESVRQHLMASLKDCGVLQGSRTKRTVRPRPGVQFTLLATCFGLSEGLTPRQLLDARWFRLLGLGTEQAADLLYAAALGGVLEFRMQAEVVELRLPGTGGESP